MSNHFRDTTLGVALPGAIALGSRIWLGYLVAFVFLQFFLFCNVFRISRTSELIWAVAFLALAGATYYTDYPGWWNTCIATAILSTLLIWRETKRPDYHGACPNGIGRPL